MKKIGCYIFVVVIFMEIHCSKNPTAGGTINTGNAYVEGVIINSSGKLAENTEVKLIPNDYNPVEDKDIPESFMDTTDSSGKYRFTNVALRLYNVLGKDLIGSDRVFIRNIAVVNDNDSVVIDEDTLKSPGNISISLPDSMQNQKGYVFLEGTGIYIDLSTLDSLNQTILIDSVPAGIMVSISHGTKDLDDPETVLFRDFVVTPNDTLNLVGSFSWKEIIIDTVFKDVNTIAAGDFNGDGLPDFVAGSQEGDGIAWWENKGSYVFEKHEIISGLNVRRVRALDFDKDGDIDVIGGARGIGDLSWYENDGSGNFTKHLIANDIELYINDTLGYTQDIDFDIADINKDGFLDIASVTSGNLVWWENDTSNAEFIRHIIIEGEPEFAVVRAADIDDDNDLDLFTGHFYNPKLTWWENDGSNQFSPTLVSSGSALNIEYIEIIDLDNDTDKDIVVTSKENGTLGWIENLGNRNFLMNKIKVNISGALGFSVVDIDGDNDLDIIGALTAPNNRIYLAENMGSQVFEFKTIAPSFDGAQDIITVDIDADGDLDIIGVGIRSGGIRLWVKE